MTESIDISNLVAEIDRLRGQLLAIEDEIAEHANRVNHRGGCDEDFRRIGEQERKAVEIRAPLKKFVERLRTQSMEAFNAWVTQNQNTLRTLAMKEISRTRPAVFSLEEALACIAREARYNNDDLLILRLSGYIEEWSEVATGKRPYALHPPPEPITKTRPAPEAPPVSGIDTLPTVSPPSDGTSKP